MNMVRHHEVKRRQQRKILSTIGVTLGVMVIALTLGFTVNRRIDGNNAAADESPEQVLPSDDTVVDEITTFTVPTTVLTEGPQQTVHPGDLPTKTTTKNPTWVPTAPTAAPLDTTANPVKLPPPTLSPTRYPRSPVQQQHTSWCRSSNDGDDCACIDPQLPFPRPKSNWVRHSTNMIENMRKNYSTGSSPDIIWLGDSIVEFLGGEHLGIRRSDLRENPAIFTNAFSRPPTPALLLGYSGDTTNNILYNLVENDNGILLNLLKPKIWILTMGTNNVGMTGCSVEAVVEGILAVARALLLSSNSSNGNTTIVLIHSILPRQGPNTHRLGGYWNDIQLINERLKGECANNDRLVYIDAASSVFINSNTNSLQHTMDGIHPDSRGYQLWVPKVATIAKQWLQKVS